MTYVFDFSDFGLYAGMLARGIGVTLGLTAAATVLGGLIGTTGAWVALAGPRWARMLVAAYVELIRNTPFWSAVLHLLRAARDRRAHRRSAGGRAGDDGQPGAYAVEILRAGIESVPHGQVQAARALGLHGRQVFGHVVRRRRSRTCTPRCSGRC